MIINGVTLPDFPEGVFEKSSYAIITRGYAPSISIDMYSIRVLPEPAIYFPPSMVDEYGIVTTMTPEYYTYNYTVGSGNTEWTDAGAVSESLDMQIGTVGVVESEVVWSNHDIYTVTAYNSDTGEVTVGSEIYFADSYRVSIGRSLMDKIATEVQRLTGTTGQMNAVTIQEQLSSAKAGIKIGDATLPPIPDGVLEEYPYVVILHATNTSGNSGWMLLATNKFIGYFDASLIGGTEGQKMVGSLGSGVSYQIDSTYNPDSWSLQGNLPVGSAMAGLEFKVSETVTGTCTPAWSNLDIYEVTSVNMSTGAYTTGDLWFAERQNFNGVWMPKIPEDDIAANSPYKVIFNTDAGPMLAVSTQRFGHGSGSVLGLDYEEVIASLAVAIFYSASSTDSAWSNPINSPSPCVLPIGDSFFGILWANHDVYEVTAIDMSTGEITTDGIYFPPLEAIDSDRVSIGYGLFNSTVKDIQRLSGETEQMNALLAYWKLTTVAAPQAVNT